MRAALVAALDALEPGASSVHVQFATEEETSILAQAGFLTRIDCQFQWRNRGYRDFDDFLATFTADKRKKAKRERRRIEEAGVQFEWRDGASLSDAEWQQVHALQIELAQSGYMDEADTDFKPARAAALIDVLAGVVDVLLAFQPA